MHPITIDEVMYKLRSFGMQVHCEMYNEYKRFSKSLDWNYICHESEGCVIIKENYEHEGIIHINYRIHQIAENADIVSVWHKIAVNSENEKVDNVRRMIMLYVCGELPDEISHFNGFRKFIRRGEKFYDSDVRKINADDAEAVKTLCSESLIDDNYFGKLESKDFYEWFDYPRDEKTTTLLGIYKDEVLTGLVSVNIYDYVTIAQVEDLFVGRDFRCNGLGRRLVKAALSMYPNMEYYYQVAKSNNASIGLAKSSGFKFAGAELCVLYE